MCGRITLAEMSWAEFRSWLTLASAPQGVIPSRYNVAPTCPVPILVRSGSGELEAKVARWGLIPAWWQKARPPASAFNARSEDVGEKPMWKEGFRALRCLMPARGWYEWEGARRAFPSSGKGRQPYFLHCPQLPVMALAGIASIWQRPGSEPVLSCAVLTKDEYAARGAKAQHGFITNDIRYDRRYGHADCSIVKAGGAGNDFVPVCQFSGPAQLVVTTGKGAFYFAPGVGRPATVATRDGVPTCVIPKVAAKF